MALRDAHPVGELVEAVWSLECPVTFVSWLEALQYLNALSKKEGFEPCYEIKGNKVKWTRGFDCKGYRLPTDAEWEFAARGGSFTDYKSALRTTYRERVPPYASDRMGFRPVPAAKP